MLAKTTQAYTEIRNAAHELQHGIVLAVDPSIGSQSSMPGWAVYSGGELVHSGVVAIDSGSSTPLRLQRLNYSIRKLVAEHQPDVMVYEAITDVPYKGFSARGHAPLQKALGAILSISGPSKYVGLFAISWTRMARETYRKGDENDAVEMGWVAIAEAKRIQELEGNPRRKKKAG